jgi:histidinol phosphatase-like enzyme
MFFQAARDHLFRLDQTLYVGDDTRDCQAAFKAGCESIFIGEEPELSCLPEHERPVCQSGELSSAVNFIKQYYSRIE